MSSSNKSAPVRGSKVLDDTTWCRFKVYSFMFIKIESIKIASQMILTQDLQSANFKNVLAGLA